MKKILLLLLIYLIIPSYILAQQTDSQYFTATAPITKSVVANGGNITATMNVDTGALSTAFAPAFTITTNSRNTQYLTLSATANIAGGNTNAIFNISTTKYIILTNDTHLPQSGAITDIKSGSPTAASNPNAVAYVINDPAAISGKLSVIYNTTNKNWDLVLTNKGQTPTSITIPANTPLNQTYSIDDESGSYKATITLSFNP